MALYYQVAVNIPVVQSTYTYKYDGELLIGDLVEVPLGKRKSHGVVLGVTPPEKNDELSGIEIKFITGKVENAFRLTKNELSLYSWMSRYYHYSLGKLVFDCLPKILKRPRKPDFLQGKGVALNFSLSGKQTEIFEKISKRNDGFGQHYIHGVTGSGKSVIYLELMKERIEKGQSVQFLLPEINLTPQFTDFFTEHLDCPVYTYHSGVTPSEKYNIWKALHEEEKPVLVMGVRSSIFLPIKNLGLIIVDEEHDQSFKQTDRCPYNGRDVAIKKAQLSNCQVVMGSATPAVENFKLFKENSQGRYYYPLQDRAAGGSLPELVLLDTKERFKENDPAWPFLDETLDLINQHVEQGEQVLVFINKLGFSQYIQCRACGHQFVNENCGCQNNLRYFKKKNLLSCAHCDFKMPLPKSCPECGNMTLMNKGFGTEKIQEVLKAVYPKMRIGRFDRDEIKTTKDLTEVLDNFHEHKLDILVGTQMLSKGHNFKRVNLVVVLGLDSMLNYADFRAQERTYQLLEQVAGRAGRYSEGAKVVVQTMNEHNTIFQTIKAHSFDGFFKEELILRELCHCPPYTKMAMMFFSSRFRERLVREISNVASSLQKTIDSHFPDIRLMGPAPLSIEKKANQFSWGIMLKSTEVAQLHKLLESFENGYKKAPNISYKIDVDPLQVL
ncbi:MAG: primosomal protein N' [Halobacteriovoraceae bacterium]|nr:primosomal protein N' [Halobacteriovoraceae bacterium]|tara:strand:- start:2150 stop:4153 length:2004 start_codon:yes stop_codon:yes gene_type:complete